MRIRLRDTIYLIYLICLPVSYEQEGGKAAKVPKHPIHLSPFFLLLPNISFLPSPFLSHPPLSLSLSAIDDTLSNEPNPLSNIQARHLQAAILHGGDGLLPTGLVFLHVEVFLPRFVSVVSLFSSLLYPSPFLLPHA